MSRERALKLGVAWCGALVAIGVGVVVWWAALLSPAIASTAGVGLNSALVVPFDPPAGLRRPGVRDGLPAFWADGRSCSVGCRANAAAGWPLRPFHVQHPLRAGLNELRTGSMHIGVDIQSGEGERVYPLQDGRAIVVHRADGDIYVRVGAFEYWHLVPAVKSGQQVRAYQTLLGTARPLYRHVHLSERVGGRYLNPLRPGGRMLAPWADHAPPVIAVPEVLGGEVTVRAFDPQTFVRSVPYQTPVLAPAALAYRIYRLDGRPLTSLRFALRGSQHYPFSQARRIFTPDAQPASFNCFATRVYCVPNWHYRLAGGLAPPLPAAPAGSYRLTVYAWDWAGNTSALDLHIHRTATAWLASTPRPSNP